MGSSIDIAALSGPVSEASPGGEDLEQTPLLAEFESQRLFGQMAPLPGDTRRDAEGPGQPKPIDWRKVRDRSLEAVQRSRDLRVLPYLGAATLRLEGVNAFLELIPVAGKWLQDLPDEVYPRLDGDGIAQANALSSWADPMAIVEPFRRAAFIRHRQLGAFSLRDLDIAQGKLRASPGDSDPVPEAQIQAALGGMEPDELNDLAAGSTAALDSIDAAILLLREKTHGEASPDLARLKDSIRRITELTASEISVRQGNAGPAAAGAESNPTDMSGTVGPIRSRQDAIRALNAVAAYFREQEPSSAVPIFVDRAKRLIGVGFLEMISDVAPDALAQIRHVGGLRDEA